MAESPDDVSLFYFPSGKKAESPDEKNQDLAKLPIMKKNLKFFEYITEKS
jgi:hypothetical protein